MRTFFIVIDHFFYFFFILDAGGKLSLPKHFSTQFSQLPFPRFYSSTLKTICSSPEGGKTLLAKQMGGAMAGSPLWIRHCTHLQRLRTFC